MDTEALKKTLGWLMGFQAGYKFQNQQSFVDRYIQDDSYIKQYNKNNCQIEGSLEYYLINTFLGIYELERNIQFTNAKHFSLQGTEALMSLCCIVLNLLCNVLMEYDRRDGNQLRVENHYYIAPDVQEITKIMYHWSLFEESLKELHDAPQLETKYYLICNKLILRYIKSNIVMIKLVVLLCSMTISPYYNDNLRTIAKRIFLELWNILYNKRINKILFSDYIYRYESGGIRTTTQLEIFFSLGNSDRYCFRLDFPHDGVDYIHLNMNEPGRRSSSGFPMRQTEITNMIQECRGKDNFDKLFYLHDDQYWFRSGFNKNVRNICGKDEEWKKALFTFQSVRGHIKIGEKMDKQKVNDFISSFCQSIIEYDIAESPYKRFGDIAEKVFKYVLFEDYIQFLSINMRHEIQDMIITGNKKDVKIYEFLIKENVLDYIKENFFDDSDLQELYEIAESMSVYEIMEYCVSIIDKHTTEFE